VPEDPRPPVAIRITRPFTTEDEFLEQELETVSRTSVTLLGAQPRPQGVVLRFELVLSSGHVLMRGEGRVVGFRPNAHQGLGGLTLRFTRLDSRSKALVDKATTLRDRRRPSAGPAAPEVSPSAPSVATTEANGASPSAPEVTGEAQAIDLESTHAEAPTSKRSERPPHPAQPALAPAPGGKEALLERLRARAHTLDATAVGRILEQRKARPR
jgi:hypothetical protein